MSEEVDEAKPTFLTDDFVIALDEEIAILEQTIRELKHIRRRYRPRKPYPKESIYTRWQSQPAQPRSEKETET